MYACICDHIVSSFLARYLVNCLWECHHIYQSGAVGDRKELIRLNRFRGQKVKFTVRIYAFCWRTHTSRWFAVEDHLLYARFDVFVECCCMYLEYR